MANGRLHEFMSQAAAATMVAVHGAGGDYRRIKINVYPDRRIRDLVSLRLFGSEHAKNNVFSRVLTPDRLLDEDGSWAAFEDHLKRKTIPVDRFNAAYDTVMAKAG
jgi:hypothetical protein